ncbi:transcriptional regulator, GntR family [Tistlia consotensis]|uniref:GntR family transcriptional regulator, vanillate catabolism transcriptional regulator n=1 Tax=Tistlia consotensis USBA 355 TaxID=560819 RepID=A0A1Y6C3Q5_9PROT|nr:GntR family transcriptional regulator [Tistlia consotensis]SMF35590.1 GntR family transcriptional regulator, vanillate catabolism transcriptional regulator [Tistlia consotensis USBA 355]SNR70989.1 transcriptional regulator, GntR family [Tistlia consotensis]
MSRPPTSTEVAAAILRERILEGSIPPGSRLQQDALAQALGLSRTPLRTAMAELAKDGLLDYSPNRGFTVRSFRLADIRAAFEVRANLEGLACRLAAERGLSEERAAELRRYVEQGDRILGRGRLDPDDLAPYRRMNVEFHEGIMATSGNPWVVEFVRRTHNVPLASDRVFLWDDYEIIRRSHDDHHRILAALLARDGRRAENIMWEHVTYAGELLCADLRRRHRLAPADPAERLSRTTSHRLSREEQDA